MNRPDIDGIREELVRWGGGDYPNVRPLLSYIEQLEAERERFIEALGDIPQGVVTPTVRALLEKHAR